MLIFANQLAVDVDTDATTCRVAECTPLANHTFGRGSSLMQGQERSSEINYVFLTDRYG